MTLPAAPRRRHKANSGALRELGELALTRRLALGLTQSDLADLAGVGLSSVRALEAGRESMTLVVALRIVDGLGLALAVAPRPDLTGLTSAVVLTAPTPLVTGSGA